MFRGKQDPLSTTVSCGETSAGIYFCHACHPTVKSVYWLCFKVDAFLTLLDNDNAASPSPPIVSGTALGKLWNVASSMMMVSSEVGGVSRGGIFPSPEICDGAVGMLPPFPASAFERRRGQWSGIPFSRVE